MKSFKQYIREDSIKNPDYSKVRGTIDNPTHFYTTAKGSTYAHGPDNTSVRFKEPRMEKNKK